MPQDGNAHIFSHGVTAMFLILYNKRTYHTTTLCYTFTFMHLSDAFIQSDLQS